MRELIVVIVVTELGNLIITLRKMPDQTLGTPTPLPVKRLHSMISFIGLFKEGVLLNAQFIAKFARRALYISIVDRRILGHVTL
jgi:hypothetical protein